MTLNETPKVLGSTAGTKDGAPPPPGRTMASTAAPEPPHSARPIELKMWKVVLHKRKMGTSAMKRLGESRYFVAFARDVVDDLQASRYKMNVHSSSLTASEKAFIRANDGCVSNDGRIDHTVGFYSSYLLRDPSLDVECLSVNDVMRHLVALFYRSIDERLPSAFRLHGLHECKQIFARMEHWTERMESGQSPGPHQNTALGSDREGGEGTSSVDAKSAAGAKRTSATASSGCNVDGGGEASSISGSAQKRLWKGPLELVTDNQVVPTSEQQKATAASTGGKRKSPPNALDLPAKKKVSGEQSISDSAEAIPAPITDSLSCQPRVVKLAGSESRPAASLSTNPSNASPCLARRPSRWGDKLPSDIPAAQHASGKAIKPAIAGNAANQPDHDGEPRTEVTARTPSVASAIPKTAQEQQNFVAKSTPHGGSLTDDEQRLVNLLRQKRGLDLSEVYEAFKNEYLGHDFPYQVGSGTTLKVYLQSLPNVFVMTQDGRDQVIYRILSPSEKKLVQLLEKKGRLRMSLVKGEFKSQYGHDLSTPSGLKRYLLAIPGIDLVGEPPRQEAMYRAPSKRGSVPTSSTAAAVPDNTTEVSSTTKSTIASASTSVRSLSLNERKIVDLIVKNKRIRLTQMKSTFKQKYGHDLTYPEKKLTAFLCNIPGVLISKGSGHGDETATFRDPVHARLSGTSIADAGSKNVERSNLSQLSQAPSHVSHKNDGRDEFGRAVQTCPQKLHSKIPPNCAQLKTGIANSTTADSSNEIKAGTYASFTRVAPAKVLEQQAVPMSSAATPPRTLSHDEQKLIKLLMKGRIALPKVYETFKSEYGHNFHYQGFGSTLVSYLEALPGVLVTKYSNEVFISSPMKEKVSSLVSTTVEDENTAKAKPESVRRLPSWTPPKTSTATIEAGPPSPKVTAQSHVAQEKNHGTVPVNAESAKYSSTKSASSDAEPLCIDLTGDDSPDIDSPPPQTRKAVATSAAKSTETTKAVRAPSSKPASYPKKIPSTKFIGESTTDKLPLKRSAVKATIPSPPASPIPQVASLRPSHRPRPRPFTRMDHMALVADSSKPTASGRLQTRVSCTMSYDAGYHRDGSGSVLQDEECAEIQERLSVSALIVRVKTCVQNLIARNRPGIHSIGSSRRWGGMRLIVTLNLTARHARRSLARGQHPASQLVEEL